MKQKKENISLGHFLKLILCVSVNKEISIIEVTNFYLIIMFPENEKISITR